MNLLKKIGKKIYLLCRSLINRLIPVIAKDLAYVLFAERELHKNIKRLKELKQIDIWTDYSEKNWNLARNYLLNLNRSELDDETLLIINFLEKSNPYLMYAYEFIKEYNMLCVNVIKDEICGMNYVLHNNKRLYFPQDFGTERCRRYYNTICIEQDSLSPHKYDAPKFIVKQGDVIADVGAAEGIWALTHVESAGKIYLFECEPKWIKSLQETFKPWKDKVVIVNKYVSDVTKGINITFDDFISDRKINFIKADIEGAEQSLLRGCSKTLETNNNLKLMICTYHRKDDMENIKSILEKAGYDTEFSQGFLLLPNEPYLRRGVIRAKKKDLQDIK